MKQIDAVLKKLKELDKSEGVTTLEIAEALKLFRSNVSGDLNQLNKMGKVIKLAGRPVRYKIKEERYLYTKSDSELDLLSECNPSLKKVVEQAKASILYPPKGMHCLILGQTGVGKSMLANLMYTYGITTKIFSLEDPFITFNCADYSNNPELLNAQLFGVKKGAYTGAIDDRMGIVEKAHGGVLFLDEIHRLPPAGQEMLFTFIDSGKFRRLGEVENSRAAEVLIICATTENPKSFLLDTFIRRIPMLIKLPDLKERTSEERLYLIEKFFREENKRIGKDIFVSLNTIKCLLVYDCPHNIGQLKNDIKLLCAKAYTDFLVNLKRSVKINSPDLPADICEALNKKKDFEKAWEKIVDEDREYYIFSQNIETSLYSNINVTEKFSAKVMELCHELNKVEEFKDIDTMKWIFLNYCDHLVEIKSKYNYEPANKESILRLIEMMNGIIEQRLNRRVTQQRLEALSIHLAMIYQRVKMNTIRIKEDLYIIGDKLQQEYETAIEVKALMENYFNLDLPQQEIFFIFLFLLYPVQSKSP